MKPETKTDKTAFEAKDTKENQLPDLSQYNFPEDYDVWVDENLDMIP